MTDEEISEILHEFVKRKEWRGVEETLERIGSPYWLMDRNGNFIYKSRRNKEFCRMIKKTLLGGERCFESALFFLNKVRESMMAEVMRCHVGLTGFACPLIADNELIGVFGGCQILSGNFDPKFCITISKQFNIEEEKVSAALRNFEQTSLDVLKTEVKLINFIFQGSIHTIIKDRELAEKDILMRNILEFYKLFVENRKLILSLEPEELYPKIVEMISKAINCKICSLMLLDEDTKEISIKAAIGLKDKIISRTRLKIGEGVVGHVIATGRPLLVKDISKDKRFRERSKGKGKYYTKSLISVPLKVGDRVIGAININNEATRRVFDEEDLKLLSIICGHAAVVIESARLQHKYRIKETFGVHRMKVDDLEKETEKVEKVKVERDELRRRTEEVIMEKGGVEEIKPDEERRILESQTKELEYHVRELEILIRELEKRAKELELEAEILEARAKILRAESEEAERLRAEVETLRKRARALKLKAERLQREAQEAKEVIARAEQIEELRTQTKELKVLYVISSQIASMQNSIQILGWVLDKIQPFFGYHIGGYLILEDGELVGEIRHKHDSPLSEECIEDIKKKIIDSWMSLVPVEEKSVKVNFSVVDEEFISPVGERYRKIESFAAVPLLEKAKIVALLVLGSFRRNAFTESDKRLLSIIASHVSVAIARVRLFDKTKELAEKDELTQLYNYRYFDKFLREEFERAFHERKPISLIMLDLDHFKEINDRYGHSEGNEVIKSFASIIRKNVKDMGIVARFGGDEFGVVLPGVKEKEASKLAKELNIDVRNYDFIIQNAPHRLSTSIGVATFPNVAVKSAKELFARGDEALYQAKQKGRDCFFIYGHV